MSLLTVVLLITLLLVQSALVLLLLYEVSALRRRVYARMTPTIHPLPIGSPSPRFVATEVTSGHTWSSERLLGNRAILLFLTPACGSCRSIFAALQMLPEPTRRNIAVVCQGSARACMQMSALSNAVLMLNATPTDVGSAFMLQTYPAGVALSADSMILDYQYSDRAGDVVDWIVQVTSPDVGTEAHDTGNGNAHGHIGLVDSVAS